jgi:Cft2 family RNA processing exonuclease
VLGVNTFHLAAGSLGPAIVSSSSVTLTALNLVVALSRHTSFDHKDDFVVTLYPSFHTPVSELYMVTVNNGSVNNTKKFTMSAKTPANFELGDSSNGNIIVTEYGDYQLQSKVLTIYAVNYNILRIMSGMASLLFSS